jgi:ferrochelatase
MGDPYRDQLLETARLVAERAALGELWSFSFQSESPTGEPWLGPDILDHLGELHAQGVERVLVCPIGFVSDHLEIRWDLDVEAQEKARELGMRLERIEMPNDDPAFIRTLARIVRRALQ